MRKLKKVAAVITAAFIVTSNLCGSISAETPVSSATWSVSHNNMQYAPEPTTITCSLYMTYSTKGNRAYCNNVSNSANGGSGRIYIRCTDANATMATITLTNASQRVDCKPEFSGEILGVHYYMYAKTSTQNNLFCAGGTMVTKK